MLHVLEVVLIQQFSLKYDLKHFGKEVEASVTKELTQHHDMQVYFSVYPNTLNTKQRAEDLAPLVFLVENRDGRIKDRSCSYRSK